MAKKRILDAEWAGNAFLAPRSALSDATNNMRRFYTSTSRKFTDTSLGGSFEINPLSQLTANCDFKHPSIYSASLGTGRWYGEVLQDSAQLIHVRCGVPQFNTMTNFFGNFYNVYAGSMARSGRAPSVWFEVGRVAGVIGTLPLQPFIFAGSVVKFFLGMPRSKYYYLKPSMYSFWYAMSGFVNAVFVNLGLSPHFSNADQRQFMDPNVIPDDRDITSMHRMIPDVVMKDGGIDVFALATKPQRLANQYFEKLNEVMDGLTDNPATRDEELRTLLAKGVDAGIKAIQDPGASLKEYEDAYLKFNGKFKNDSSYASDSVGEDKDYFDQMQEAFRAERRMGADFVTFRVNYTGSNSDSWNNQAGDPSIKSEINNMSSKARAARFNIMDGNVGGPLGTLVGIASDIAKGILTSAQVEGFIAVAGNAFADIQRTYESSSCDVNRTTFTIPLRSWAADDWVRLKNLFIPLGAIFAMALPRATGRASYDGPPLLEIFNRGHTLIREGMVESITVERNVGDIGMGREAKTLGIDVNVTIIDMSTMVSMPINPGFSGVNGVFSLAVEGIGAAGGAVSGAGASAGASAGETVAAALSKSTYGEDNKYTDYLATLTSLPLETLINGTRRWRLNMARTRAEFNQWKSANRVVSGLMDNFTGEMIKATGAPTSRP
jgi:hypothetical protein